ncbi:MAG: polysaccharide deacetylase family protein [Rubrobacteraceae bacterium]|nr:polysaccharide deacetylase family protein [Rubrobacteraceae bacterium]
MAAAIRISGRSLRTYRLHRRSNGFDAGCEPEEAICSWDDLRELERLGVSIQSHGASHCSFSKLSRAEQEEELAQSKITLEAGTFLPCRRYPNVAKG